MFGAEAAVNIVAIGPEVFRVRRAQEGTESGAADAPRLRQISFGQWSNDNAHSFLPFRSKEPVRKRPVSLKIQNSRHCRAGERSFVKPVRLRIPQFGRDVRSIATIPVAGSR